MPNKAAPRRRRALDAERFEAGSSSARSPAIAVAVDSSARDQAGERILELAAQQPRALGDLVEERRAVRREVVDDAALARAEPGVVRRQRREAAPERGVTRGSSRTGVARSEAVPRAAPFSAGGRSRVHRVRPAVHRSSSHAVE
jgi:hypothetical protein